jgi:hypothetical protein
MMSVTACFALTVELNREKNGTNTAQNLHIHPQDMTDHKDQLIINLFVVVVV